MTAYFRSLAQDWRGWDGDREWTSLEGDLHLTAKHDGHVRVQASLRPQNDWTVTALISLEAGEELAAAARDLTDLLG